MLAVFRKHTKGLIAWAFVILVSIPFVFFGVGQFSSLVIANYVAKVNGEKIMPNVFQDAYRQAYQQASPDGDLSPAQEKTLKQQVLQQLINQTLLLQQAQADHMVTLKPEIRAEIDQISAFQSNGKFNLAQYQAVLASNGLSPDAFEARVARQLLVRQLQGGLAATVFVTPVEFTSMISLLKEKRTALWGAFPLSRYPGAAPDAKMISAYYRAHQQSFVLPETVTLNYVQLDKTELEKRVKITPQELQSFYETNQILYGIPAARKAAQILIKPKNDSPQGWAEAREKAEHILEIYHEKTPGEKRFAELARKYSDDLISRRNGGSMGWIARGQVNNGFGKALFSIAKKGQVAGPVKTASGWSLIRLLGIRPGSVQPFAAVKNKVIAAYRAEQTKKLYYQLGDKLANLAYEHPGSLVPITKELGLKVHSISGVTRNSGSGIAGSKAIRKAAFSPLVLDQGMNSAPVKMGPQNAVVLRVAQVHKSRVKPLARVKSKIIALLLRQETIANAHRAAKQALTKIEAGEPIENVMKSLRLKLVGPKIVSRGAAKLPPELVAAVFSLAPNPRGKPQFGLVELGNGTPLIYELTKVEPGRINDLKKPEAEIYQTQIAQINAQTLTASYLSWLRKRADIAIEKKNIP